MNDNQPAPDGFIAMKSTGSLKNFLPAHPDEMVICRDDRQVLGLIIGLNITAFNVKDTGRNSTRTHAYHHHPTHWLFLIRYSNYETKTENGYVAVCLNKSGGDMEAFHRMAAGMLSELAASSQSVRQEPISTPSEN